MAKKREPLGRGLDVLLGATPSLQDIESDSGILTVPITKVEANAQQPRRNFDPEALTELSESIAEHGIIQPLVVRLLQSGYYQIISGERRWRAARQAGLEEVPVIVIEADDRKVTELSLIENLQRQDLNPMEEAQGYERLISEYGLNQEDAAQRVGKARSTVANALRLLTLPEAIKEVVIAGDLTAGHARAILGVPDEAKQLALAEKAKDLSVRQTEQLAKQLAKPEPEEQPKKPNRDEVDYYAVAAEDLGSRLGRKVKIISGKKKGHLELEYYDMDDLNGLLEELGRIHKKG